MAKNLQNIEDLFRNALEDNEDEIPTSNAWDGIEHKLDKDAVVSIKKKYNNLKKIAILLLCLLSGFTFYEINKRQHKISESNTVSIQQQNKNLINKNKKENTTTTVQKNLMDTVNNIAVNKTNNETKTNISTTENVAQTQASNTLTVNSVSEFKNDLLTLTNDANRKKKIRGKELTNKEKAESTTEYYSEHDIVLNNKKKLQQKQSYKVKITNVTATEDETIVNDKNMIADVLPKENKKVDKNNSATIKDSLKTNTIAKIVFIDTTKSSLAKKVEKVNTKLSKFSITPFFSPDIAWYRLQDDKRESQADDALETEKNERHQYSSTYGVLADYAINKHWGLQSGITLTNTNITIEPKNIYAQADNNGSIKYKLNSSSGYGYVLPSFSSNPVIGDSLYLFASSHSLQYIGIPLAVTYSIQKNKLNFKAIAGISTNFLTKAKIETTVEKGFDNEVETIDKLQGVKPLYFSGLLGVGASYNLTKKLAITFAPTLRFALTSINKDATVKSYPMALGFSVGFTIKL